MLMVSANHAYLAALNVILKRNAKHAIQINFYIKENVSHHAQMVHMNPLLLLVTLANLATLDAELVIQLKLVLLAENLFFWQTEDVLNNVLKEHTQTEQHAYLVIHIAQDVLHKTIAKHAFNQMYYKVLAVWRHAQMVQST